MARLSKQQLQDRARYRFRSEEVEIPELGGSVEIKTLTVRERDALPDMVDENGKPKASINDAAAVFAAIVSDPKLSAAEAEEFLGDLPATALDRVVERFGELLSTKEDQDAAASEFRPAGD